MSNKQLKNEADADKRLYEELVRKIREAGINAGFQNSSIRLADEARPAIKPVSPNVTLNVLLAFLFSAALGVGLAVLSDAMDQTIRDAEQIGRTLGIEVIGMLPTVKGRRSLSHLLAAGVAASQTDLVKASQSLVATNPSASTFHEAVQMLRSSVLLADFDESVRSILLTSPGPGEGKSTTSLHLAVSHARQQRSVLIIDADLRRPQLHKHVHIDSSRGLGNVLAGEATVEDVTIQSPTLPHLHMILAGPPTTRAAELVEQGMSEVLAQVTKKYDLVVIDGPPLLGFAETLQIASLADGVLVLALAGETKRQAVAAAITVLKRLRANLLGLILNKVDHINLSSGSHYYGYLQYHTKHYRTAETG